MANKILAGEYSDKVISLYHVPKRGTMHCIPLGKGLRMWKEYIILADEITRYEIVDEETRKSAASGVARGLVGGALLGPVGMMAGGISAKSKGTYQLAVEFKDGKRSLLEVDDKLYKEIVKSCF